MSIAPRVARRLRESFCTMAQPADLFGAGVTDDPARRNTRPELSCRPGNLAPVRAKQMKSP